jgi:hypothetical protein
MLLFLRRLKHLHFMSDEFRRYLAYALGEMVLVIIGILIALQIDNWNTDRKEAATLRNYLQTIARNMREDIGELQVLHATRSARILEASNARNFLTGLRKQSFTQDEIYFLNKVTFQLGNTLYFRADSSGFEALKSSGVFDRLQGQSIERVLSKYYDQVRLIEDLELRLNEAMNSASSRYQSSIPDNDVAWAFSDPRALLEGQFEEFQPVYAMVINGPAVREMLGLEYETLGIVREYDRLRQLGAAFIDMVASGNLNPGELDGILFTGGDATDDPAYYARLVTEGQIAVQTYFVSGVAAGFEPVFDFRALQKIDDALRIDYPGSESWAAIFLLYRGTEMGRASRDFSHFDKLVLELRGDQGGEVITVSIKDRYLPDTEPPESMQLRVTDEWQTYEIDLADFGGTDLTTLITPLSFIFEREPQSFWLRNARYVTSN